MNLFDLAGDLRRRGPFPARLDGAESGGARNDFNRAHLDHVNVTNGLAWLFDFARVLG